MNATLRRWFVQYDPTFTASALCVLGGVLLAQRGFGADASLALTAILELYQWLVIGVAALLYRRLNEHRSATILGFVALVFLVDPTLQLSALAGGGHVAATIAWVALFAAKWRALEHAFRLRVSWSVRVLAPVVAACVAALPNARVLDVPDDVLPGALGIAVFLVGSAFVLAPPVIASRRALAEVGATMFPRCVRAVAWIGGAGVAYQLVNALLALGAEAFAPVACAALLVLVVRARSEGGTWALAFVAGVVAAIAVPDGRGPHGELVVFASLLACALLLASRRLAPRVLVVGVLAAVASVAVVVPPSERATSVAFLAVGGVATFALLVVLVKRRAWSAAPALALLHARTVVDVARFVRDAAPDGPETYAAALLLAGFALVPVGVVLHRRLARGLDDAPARAGAPATPAAIGTLAA